MTLAYLGLGANVGDREANLELARAELDRTGATIVRSTAVVETEPFGISDQPPFLNQVLEVEWEGTPEELLAAAKAVEQRVGRTPTYRWGPREIDVDILLFGDRQVRTSELEIPHPGLRQRDFVRDQLLELRPDLARILEK